MSRKSQDNPEDNTVCRLVACNTCCELYNQIDIAHCRFTTGSSIERLVSLNHFSCIKRLLQQRNSSKEPLLLGAVAFGCYDCLREILSNISIQDIFGKGKLGSKALHMAARRGQSKVLKILLDTGISPDCRLDTGPPGLTAAYLAAANGHPQCLQILLENGGEGSLVPGVSPLYGAVVNEHQECTSLLLKYNVWGGDQGGEVLSRLALEGNLCYLETIVQQLTELGLREVHKDSAFRTINIPKLRDNIQAAARQAARAGHAKCLTILLYSAFSDVYSTSSVQSLILETASNGHTNCLNIVLEVGVIVNVDAAIAAAAQKGHLSCLQVLCAYNGMSPLARDQAVYESAVNGHDACLNFLVEYSERFLPEPVSDIILEDSVEGCASKGYFGCLTLLLLEQLSNFHNCSQQVVQKAILSSIEGDHFNCLELLYQRLEGGIMFDGHYEAISAAPSWGRTRCLRMLLDVELFSRHSSHSINLLQSALIEAAKWGHDECAELLTEKTGVSIADKPELYARHMTIAALVDYCNGLTSFLKLGASPNAVVPKHASFGDDWRETILLYLNSLKDGFSNLYLKEHFCFLSAPHEGDAPLLAAVRFKSFDATKILLNWGANPNIMDRNGDSPLILAASHGDVEALKLLLRFGAHPDLCHATSQRTALEYAAEKRHADCVVVLLQYNARVDLVNRLGHKYWPQIEQLFDTGGCYTYSKFPGYREWYPFIKSTHLLQQFCRSCIRKQLVVQNPRSNLFHMVPKLPVPSKLQHFILYNS